MNRGPAPGQEQWRVHGWDQLLSVPILYIYTTQFHSALVITVVCLSSLQNKCRTVDPDQQNLSRSGKLSFFTIYKFWKNCAFVRQVSDLILKTVPANVPEPFNTKASTQALYWLQVKVFWHSNDLGCHFADHKTIWNKQWNLFTCPSILPLYVRGMSYLGFN